MGNDIASVTPDRVEATLTVREELRTKPAVLHGGAMMAPADTFGALSTIANPPKGAWTTTIESKTNFIGDMPFGDTARAECTAVQCGRTTMVWQTRISRGDGNLAGSSR